MIYDIRYLKLSSMGIRSISWKISYIKKKIYIKRENLDYSKKNSFQICYNRICNKYLFLIAINNYYKYSKIYI